jgi:hypothetical protein
MPELRELNLKLSQNSKKSLCDFWCAKICAILSITNWLDVYDYCARKRELFRHAKNLPIFERFMNNPLSSLVLARKPLEKA